MQVESSFDPNQVSGRSAHGLMQIVPETAGREVNRWLGREGEPSPGELLNPEQNIRYGVIYLHLLHSAHLDGISNPLSREYCAIASYNGGSGMVLRRFGSSREEAFDVINTMTPEEVRRKLLDTRPRWKPVLSCARCWPPSCLRRCCGRKSSAGSGMTASAGLPDKNAD